MDEKNSTEESDDRELIVPLTPALQAALHGYSFAGAEKAAYERGFETGRTEGFDDACRWVLSALRDRPAIRAWETGTRPPDKAAGWSPLLGSAPWAATYLEFLMAELPAERPQ